MGSSYSMSHSRWLFLSNVDERVTAAYILIPVTLKCSSRHCYTLLFWLCDIRWKGSTDIKRTRMMLGFYWVTVKINGWMNGVSGHGSALSGYTEQGITWANDMNFYMNYAPGGGSNTRLVDLQSSMLPLCCGSPTWMNEWCFRPQICIVRLYWAGDILGLYDEFG